MVTAEGVFPKVGNDPLYVSEINPFGTSGIVSETGSKTIIHFGQQSVGPTSSSNIIFSTPFSAIPRVTVGVQGAEGIPGNVGIGSFTIGNSAPTSSIVDWIAIGTQ